MANRKVQKFAKRTPMYNVNIRCVPINVGLVYDIIFEKNYIRINSMQFKGDLNQYKSSIIIQKMNIIESVKT